MFDLAGFDISRAAAAVAATRRLLKANRRAGVRVIYLQMSYRQDLGDAGDASSPNYHKELGITMMRQRPELRGKLLVNRQLGLADRRGAAAGAGRPCRPQIPLQRLLRHRPGNVFAGGQHPLPAVHRGRDQRLRRKHRPRRLLRGILADHGRGRDKLVRVPISIARRRCGISSMCSAG